RDDETALAAADRGDDVDRAPGDAVPVGRRSLAGQQLEGQAFRRIERHAHLRHVAQNLEAAALLAPVPVRSGTGAPASRPLHHRGALTHVVVAPARRGTTVHLRRRVVERAVVRPWTPAAPALLALRGGTGEG